MGKHCTCFLTLTLIVLTCDMKTSHWHVNFFLNFFCKAKSISSRMRYTLTLGKAAFWKAILYKHLYMVSRVFEVVMKNIRFMIASDFLPRYYLHILLAICKLIRMELEKWPLKTNSNWHSLSSRKHCLWLLGMPYHVFTIPCLRMDFMLKIKTLF